MPRRVIRFSFVPAALGLLLAAAGLSPSGAASPSSASALLMPAGSELPPPVTEPGLRASALGLPIPTTVRSKDTDVCAVALDAQNLPPACFPNESDSARFIAGTKAGEQRVILSGTGGTQLTTSSGSGVKIAHTCYAIYYGGGPLCTGSYYDFYAISSPYYACTHAYPNNDYARDSVTSFNYMVIDAEGLPYNCNKAIFYVDYSQVTASGYKLCANYSTVCYDLSREFHSFSIHNSGPS